MKTTRTERQQRHFSELCLGFPGVTETEGDEGMVYCVGREPFARFLPGEGKARVAVRIGSEELDARSKDGYVTLSLEGHVDWEELRGLLMVAYVALAPKKLLQELDDALSA